MAVQQNKTSRRRTRMRRSHHRLDDNPAFSVDPTTGETHRRHHLTPDGYYRGEKILEKIQKLPEESNGA